jgi:hypothetical protein
LSAKTDQYEVAVARWINRTSEEIAAVRPKVSVAFSDIYLTKPGYESVWLEVKTDHTDNLSNPRVFFDKQWQTNYVSLSAKVTVDILNTQRETREFIRTLSEFAEIPLEQLKIPTSKAQFKGAPGVVPIDVLKEYFEVIASNRYIANVVNYDIGALITADYAERNVHYMQAGDDFYIIGETNPFSLPDDIPIIEGTGDFKIRISTRADFSEVQAELKLASLPRSQYSCKPNTEKLNPFIV